MPNHIKNRVQIIGTKEQVKNIIAEFGTRHPARLNRAYDGSIICKKTGSKEFSVGWLNEKTGVFTERGKDETVGIPEEWEMEINEAFLHFPDFNKVVPQPKNIFNGNLSREDEERCKKENIPTWYEWNRENWGTKWNSYSFQEEDENVFTFETAWSGVPRIIEKMSEKFPEVTILYEYSDEDTGQNVGSSIFKNGLLEDESPEDGSKEAYDLAFNLRPESKEYYHLVGDQYEPIED